MSDLAPLNQRPSRHPMTRSDARHAARATSQLTTQASVESSRIKTVAELQALRIEAVGHVGRRAEHNLALLTQLEQQLTMLVPLAAGRLQAIGDMTALAVA